MQLYCLRLATSNFCVTESMPWLSIMCQPVARSYQADGFVQTCDTKQSLIESSGWTLTVSNALSRKMLAHCSNTQRLLKEPYCVTRPA
jgi:hypothetical protein